MPSTSSASISSRMVRAPRSAQIAVDPAPATTSTVDQRPQLGDGGQRRARAGDVGGAELRQEDVEREDKEHGQRNRDRERGQERDLEQEPALEDELAPLEARRNSALAVSTHMRTNPPTASIAGLVCLAT